MLSLAAVNRRLSPLACLLLAVFFLATGCSHYRLGTDSKLSFRTLYLEPVENKSLLPQSRAIVTTQLRETFARDGRISLVNSSAEADATLKVVISDYHRDIATVREGDTGLARKFTLTLGTLCTLRERSGKIIFENRPLAAQRVAFTDSGQLQSEYQTLPLLADAVAAKIARAALDSW